MRSVKFSLSALFCRNIHPYCYQVIVSSLALHASLSEFMHSVDLLVGKEILFGGKLSVWILWLINYYTAKAGGVVRSLHLLLHSFVPSVSTITHERTNGRRSNIVGIGNGWHCRNDYFWCWSGSRCGSRICNVGSLAFYIWHCHSPGGDTAVALVEFVLS